MYLPDRAQKNLRTLGDILYSRSLDTAALHAATPGICAAMDSHYFAFCRFSPNRKDGAILYSNNPPEFIDTYTSVQDKDFILTELMERRKSVSLIKIPGWNTSKHYDFTVPVQKIRPISDVLYVPAHIRGILAGYWAIGRAGLNSPIYSDNEFKTFEFISDFLSDALTRSLEAFPQADDVALLDARGRVLYAGDRIASAFRELFGAGARECTCRSREPAAMAFRDRFLGFLRGTRGPWNSRFLWTDTYGRSHDFSFQIQGCAEDIRGIPPLHKLIILVTLRPEGRNDMKSALSLDRFREDYGMTDREIEILQGIYRGWSNKDIAESLHVSEPTVKRSLGGIYEKTGTTTRTRLLLKLSL